MHQNIRVYQDDWPGREVFFCDGRLVAGPGWKNLFITISLVWIPMTIYLVWPARYLGEHLNWSFFIIGAVLGTLCVTWLLITACMDPGIMPRESPDEEYRQGNKPRTTDVQLNGCTITVRYDETCHFYRPPRCHHCSINDNCIQRFDHHCPWVGTTIGLRNYRFFVLFVATCAITSLFVFATCVLQIHERRRELEEEKGGGVSVGKTLEKTVAALALIIYTFIQIWLVGGLLMFHLYLIATNQTTYENYKRAHNDQPNPYSKGLFINCWEVWCSKIPSPKVNFRELVGVRENGSKGHFELAKTSTFQVTDMNHNNNNNNNHHNHNTQLSIENGYLDEEAPYYQNGTSSLHMEHKIQQQ
eukprot:TRINITY_DN4817_c0_g1_i7.p2 TRINITY_DN4817_c0_g1~~TRINITY_DN4817_c0_g1_i7.p2  ORF type:complete len:358 (-),score=26.13 TRINITY_DN4817_c0_g1_i7:3449-4522(-)